MFATVVQQKITAAQWNPTIIFTEFLNKYKLTGVFYWTNVVQY